MEHPPLLCTHCYRCRRRCRCCHCRCFLNCGCCTVAWAGARCCCSTLCRPHLHHFQEPTGHQIDWGCGCRGTDPTDLPVSRRLQVGGVLVLRLGLGAAAAFAPLSTVPCCAILRKVSGMTGDLALLAALTRLTELYAPAATVVAYSAPAVLCTYWCHRHSVAPTRTNLRHLGGNRVTGDLASLKALTLLKWL